MLPGSLITAAAAAPPGYELVTNLSGAGRQSWSVMKLKASLAGVSIVHLLCHGVLDDHEGLYLKIEDSALGHLTPLRVYGFQLLPNAVVLVNSCSSAAATFGMNGFSSFGRGFSPPAPAPTAGR
jgi:hypothetical protein